MTEHAVFTHITVLCTVLELRFLLLVGSLANAHSIGAKKEAVLKEVFTKIISNENQLDSVFVCTSSAAFYSSRHQKTASVEMPAFHEPPEPPSPTRGAEHQCMYSAACQSTLISQHKKTRTELRPVYVRDDVKWPEFIIHIKFFV